ncbi:hypothetical protein GGR31_002596 [Mesonia maritima]|uniref:Uncharacterized protein n=1 Tax=Mesonia maritima TaxID=1793873 RepID=A0ABU1K8I0_9FLAO|nr:hypothetical protein [Mesonia maritima]
MKNFLLSIAFILFSTIIGLAQTSESIYIGFSEEVNFQ